VSILKEEIKEHFSWEDEEENENDNSDVKEELKEEKKKHKKEEKKESEESKAIPDDNRKTTKKSKKKKKSKKYLIWAVLIIIVASYLVIQYQDMIMPKLFPNKEGTKVVAVVNGQEITAKELDIEYNLFVPSYMKAVFTKESFLNESLIIETLILQENEAGITTTDEEVDYYLNTYLASLGISKEELVSNLKERGISFEDMVKLYKKRITVSKIIEEKIGSQIQATDYELKDYYNNNKNEFSAKEGQIKASHILIAIDEDTTEEQAKEKIEEIYEKVKAGEDFAELAKENSDCPSSAQGGDLGFFEKGIMVPEFEEAAFALKVGEVSEPVKTSFGYHIIKRGSGSLSFEESKEMIEESLITSKKQAVLETYTKQILSKADVQIYKENIQNAEPAITPIISETKETSTFTSASDDICKKDGKPIIRMFSAAIDPHSQWISNTFLEAVSEYDVIAENWQIDTGDNLLTEEIESSLPKEEFDIYKKYNSEGTVPTFVFGCKYVRIGNGYEEQGDIEAEKAEFKAIIEKLI